MGKENKTMVNEDCYNLLYHMMYESLKTDDVVEGLNKSLYFLKIHLGSGDVVLHRKEDDGLYEHYMSQARIFNSTDPIVKTTNSAARIVENRGSFYINLDQSEDFKSMLFLGIKSDNHDYMNNVGEEVYHNEAFLKELLKTMQIILKRAEMYERNTKAIYLDKLTGLKNRNSYEATVEELDGTDSPLIYGIFDLFRLKYINDNYNHSLGDKYIIEAGSILRSYWPEFILEKDKTGAVKKVLTGSSIYRVGGDEFVLISQGEPIELARAKAALAAEEVSNIDLGEDNLPIGLNVGIVSHMPGETIKDSYDKADQLMQEDKKMMYKRLGLDRRR